MERKFRLFVAHEFHQVHPIALTAPLSTIRDADVILVMESGAIVEQGGPIQLLATRGRHYDPYNSQFIGAIDE